MREKHELSGKTVRLNVNGEDPDTLNGQEFVVEDWWINVAGQSWMTCDGNPACLRYAIRSAGAQLPIDNEVVYGKVGIAGFLVHASELGQVVTPQ